jgi:hypothetical protein
MAEFLEVVPAPRTPNPESDVVPAATSNLAILLGLPLKRVDVIDKIRTVGEACFHRVAGGLHRCSFPMKGVEIGYDASGIIASLLLAGPHHVGLQTYKGALPEGLPSLGLTRGQVRNRFLPGRSFETFGATDCYPLEGGLELCVQYQERGRRGIEDDEIECLWYSFRRVHPLHPNRRPDWNLSPDGLPEYHLSDLPLG